MISTRVPIYDTIIIGAGISGLYAAYKIRQRHPHASVLILEKTPRVGGRAGTEMFHGTRIAIGAGVGRKKKDCILLDLLKELKVEFHEFPAKTSYTSGLQEESAILAKQFRYLQAANREKAVYEKYKGSTFAKFAEDLLGEEEYRVFSQCAGYTDYERADVSDVLKDYGFDDNTSPWIGFSVDWNAVIDSLVESVDRKNIRTNQEVSKMLRRRDNTIELYTKERISYVSNRVVIASTIDTVKHLLPSKHNLYKEIHGQPFLRIYGKFTKPSAAIMAQYVPTQTVVQGPIHKIIPMNPKNGVFMVVYSDNAGATLLNKYHENTAKNRNILCRYLERALGIPGNTLTMTDMRDFYWKIGTHYYAPMNGRYRNRAEFIRQAQMPFPDVFVVGEMISRDQGWVRGCLDSVDKILPRMSMYP